MYPVTVTIDRVFSIARRRVYNGPSGHGGPTTEFGFASGTKRYYGLTLPGWPAIEAGMTVTAILEKEGDWNSLQGWFNHATGELVSPSRANHVLQLLVCGVLGYSVCDSLDNAVSIAIFLFCSAIVLLSGSMLWRTHRAIKALASLARAAPPA